MEAAKGLFLEKRYSEITVDEIAERAGVTKRTLYKYFPSKLALFIVLFEEYLQAIYIEITAVIGLDIPKDEILGRIFQALFEYTKKNEKFMYLFWTLDSDEFLGLIPEELSNRINVWNKAMIEEVVKFIVKEQNEGIIKKCDPELLAHLLSAINKGIFTHTNKESKFHIKNIDPDDLYNMCSDFFIPALLNK